MSFSIRHDVLISHAVVLQLEHQDRVSIFKQKKSIILNNCVTPEVKILFYKNKKVQFWLKIYQHIYST